MILSIPILVKVLGIAAAAFVIAGVAYHDWRLLITPTASAAAGWLAMWPVRNRLDRFAERLDEGLDRIDRSLGYINIGLDRNEERTKKVPSRNTARRKPS
jgi:hypothetical protein